MNFNEILFSIASNVLLQFKWIFIISSSIKKNRIKEYIVQNVFFNMVELYFTLNVFIAIYT